ncbi:MAG TPA: UdgX family uracil-DNA binding protein [Gemmatimonadaceae bacterium]|nr:UdgX family uracil-DNA binding protein [Gemmatimonadaceae bacterium]
MPRRAISDPTEEQPSAAPFLPEQLTLPALKEAAGSCRGCHLYRDATQTVFGAGKRSARVVLVGEQPGNEEDQKGRPFVGPAGKILDRALEDAGVDRDEAYVTNVVKHFKFERRGKLRIHKKPNALEIRACLPWLAAELEVLKPRVLVCLGATAAQALLGRTFSVMAQRGKVIPTPLAEYAVATVHPSSILRQQTSEEREKALHDLIADLRVVAQLLDRP